MEQEKVAALVEENMKTIFAYSLSRVSHKEDAEDLCSDIILAILISAPRIRDDNAFFGYIWAIAANTYKKYLRKKNRAIFTELDEATPEDSDFTERLVKTNEIQVLRRELSLLSSQYRECTVAYYIDGLSCAETATTLGISLEMVKYYLFKTRKLLKEGIGMEREFGEKSYKPAKFEFNTIFSGNFNREYTNLFNRKLPGNILLSAYYTPMTIRELSIELGVSSAYMEDEIALLKKYNLLIALSGGKYQPNLVIFTKEYADEFHKKARKQFANEIGEILCCVKNKLPEIRKVGFIGNELSDNQLLWSLLFPMIRDGNTRFEHPLSDEIYNGATGINYGVAYDEYEDEFGCYAFAGYAEINNFYAAAFADFGVLGENNCYSRHDAEMQKYIEAVTSGNVSPVIPIVSHNQRKMIEQIVEPETEKFKTVYSSLSKCATEVMRSHAPKGISDIVEKVISTTIFYRTVSLIAVCTVDSGELLIPNDNSIAAALIYEATEHDKASVSEGVQV